MPKQRGESYQVDFRWGGQRIRRQFVTEEQALQWEAWAKARLKQGLPLDEVATPGKSDRWTLKKLYDAVVARHWKGSANELDACRNAEQCCEYLGWDKHPGEITAEAIDSLIHHLKEEEGNGPATINRKTAALGKMLSHAMTRGIITSKPHIERQRETAGRLRWFTIEEEQRILQTIRNPDFYALVVFLLDTGCRLGEALAIEWRDIDDTYARFHHTKNGTARAIPMPARLKALLAARRPLAATGRVFEGWTVSKADKAWAALRKDVGLKGREDVLHALRHTCASRLVQAGVPIQVVSQWLGHKSLTMTLRYAHLSPTNLQSAAGVLDMVTSQTDKIRSGLAKLDGPHHVTNVTTAASIESSKSALAG